MLIRSTASDSGRDGDPLRGSGAGRGWWKWAALAPGDLDPVLDDPAEPAIDLDLVHLVTAGPDDPRTLPDERTVLVRPLDHLGVWRSLALGRISSIALRTSRS
jgi:hypothetical protein